MDPFDAESLSKEMRFSDQEREYGHVTFATASTTAAAPPCTFMCRERCPLRPAAYAQPGTAHLNGLSPVCIARQCDLALVQVDEDSFWEDLPTVSFSDELPELDTNVTAVGYPMCAPLLPSSSHSPTHRAAGRGGDNLSITRGVVSRVDLMDYTMLGAGDPPLMTVQIDAEFIIVKAPPCSAPAKKHLDSQFGRGRRQHRLSYPPPLIGMPPNKNQDLS